MMINGNWGQGETVVSGLATPDSVTINKWSMAIENQSIGSKEVAIFLGSDGSPTQRTPEKQAELCMTEEEMGAIGAELKKIEDYYGQPMDIEWAIEKSSAYLVQARPITTHLALDPSMVTPPGKARQLYLDVTLAVQGLADPLSPMGTSFLNKFFGAIRSKLLGVDQAPPADSLFILRAGRIFLNFSNMAKLVGPQKVAAFLGQMDPATRDVYLQREKEDFSAGKVSRVGIALGAIPRVFPILLRLRRNFKHPEGVADRWYKQWDLYKAELVQIDKQGHSLGPYVDRVLKAATSFLTLETITIFICAKLARMRMESLFPDQNEEIKKCLDLIDQGLQGNVTVEMGHNLFELFQSLEGQPEVLSHLPDRLANNELPPKFRDGWQKFIARYGHRGMREIDMASPRYREDPSFLLQQIQGFAESKEGEPTPIDRFHKREKERKNSFETLAKLLSGTKKAKFHHYYRLVEALGGFRETHKFVLVYTLDQVRKRILSEAESLISSNRLESIEDLFLVSLEQLQQALANPDFPLQDAIRKGKESHARNRQCKQSTPLLDSRGKFYRPKPRQPKKGEVIGQAVSAGVARG
jgi:pyruvate,water dikinase